MTAPACDVAGLIAAIPVGLEPGAFRHAIGVGSCHRVVRLPDGRNAMADYRQSVVHVMHRVHGRIMDLGHTPGRAASADDFAILARWLDAHPEQACSATHCAPHGPPTAEPFTPKPYREEV